MSTKVYSCRECRSLVYKLVEGRCAACLDALWDAEIDKARRADPRVTLVASWLRKRFDDGFGDDWTTDAVELLTYMDHELQEAM